MFICPTNLVLVVIMHLWEQCQDIVDYATTLSQHEQIGLLVVFSAGLFKNIEMNCVLIILQVKQLEQL